MSIGITFSLLENGDKIGVLQSEVPPTSPGDYNYMPLRGPSHYRFAESLRAGKYVSCYCGEASERVIFEVSAIPSYGRIVVSRVDRAG